MPLRGLYRTKDRLLGECVKVDWCAGDAAPFVSPVVYTALGGKPELSALPTRQDYEAAGARAEADPLELA